MFYSKMVLGGGGNVREGGSEGDGGGEDGGDEDGSNGNGTWMGAYGECGTTEKLAHFISLLQYIVLIGSFHHKRVISSQENAFVRFFCY